ncbi:MAG: MMPL family transporter [Acidimicrobiales bacterium]
MLARWTRAVARWRVVVLVVWIAAGAGGLLGYHQLTGRLTTSLSVPGTPSARADALLRAHFHESIEGAFTVVVRASGSRVARDEARLTRAAARCGLHAVEERAVGGLLVADLESPDSLGRAAALTPRLRAALRSDGLPGALVTGPAALQADVTPILAADLRRGEALALAAALVLLTAILGVSAAVLIPFVVAGLTTAVALGLVDLLASWRLMVLYVPNVVALIGLGLAIDYSLLIVHRYRAELSGGADGALERTMASAGRTVVLSGAAVAVGLALMLAIPVPLVASLGAAGLAVPVVAVAAALTLQPALLALARPRGVAVHAWAGLLEPPDPGRGRWARLARAVVARPWRVLAAALVVLGALAAGVSQLALTPGSLSAIPSQMPSARAIALVRATVGPGVLTPLEVLIDTGRPGGVRAPGERAAQQSLALRLLRVPDVELVATDVVAPFVDPRGQVARILVISTGSLGSPTSQRLVGVVRRLSAAARFPSGTSVVVGGAPAQGVDFLHAVYHRFGWLVALALASAFLLLTVALGSALLALWAVVLDLASIAAAYGGLAWWFHTGLGSVTGTYHVAQIEGWVPVFTFAVLFGLSMDYEVFIVARLREAHRAGRPIDEAIVEALASTGGVVTSAAVIMVGALAGFVLGRVAGLQELGVGLALGVLVDAVVVRGLVLPSVLALSGRWLWHGERRTSRPDRYR